MDTKQRLSLFYWTIAHTDTSSESSRARNNFKKQSTRRRSGSVWSRYPVIFRDGTPSAPGRSHLNRSKRALFLNETFLKETLCESMLIQEVTGLLPLGNGPARLREQISLRRFQANGLCSREPSICCQGKFQLNVAYTTIYCKLQDMVNTCMKMTRVPCHI